MSSQTGPLDSSRAHRQTAEESLRGQRIRCGIITVSDTRTNETDAGGALIREHLEAQRTDSGESMCEVVASTIVKDDPAQIRATFDLWLGRSEIDVIITTGGTGIARRDTTIEIVQQLLTTPLDGFGELFRMLSFEEVGSAAMLSRATAGLVIEASGSGAETFIFSLPGSVNAIQTAMEKLILPELPHLIWERSR